MSENKYRFKREPKSVQNKELINQEAGSIFKLIQDAAANKEIDVMLALKLSRKLETLRNLSIGALDD
jgi:hypothetical protein